VNKIKENIKEESGKAGNAKPQEKRSKRKLGNPIKGLVSGDVLGKGGVTSNLPFLLFVTGLMVVYIGYGYYVDNTVRSIANEERKAEELYSELQSVLEIYDQESLQSEVAEEVKPLGLFETKDPPRVIWVRDDFYTASED